MPKYYLFDTLINIRIKEGLKSFLWSVMLEENVLKNKNEFLMTDSAKFANETTNLKDFFSKKQIS